MLTFVNQRAIPSKGPQFRDADYEFINIGFIRNELEPELVRAFWGGAGAVMEE